MINAYCDSLNKFEQIAYDSGNFQLVEYLNECEEFLEIFKKEKNDARLINYNIQSRIRLRNELMSSALSSTVRKIMINVLFQLSFKTI